MGVIEQANALPLDALRSLHLSNEPLGLATGHQGPLPSYAISLETSSSISASDFNACFQLIQDTSAEMYRNSSVGWSAAKKKKEMKLPDLRYLLVKTTIDGHNDDENERRGADGTRLPGPEVVVVAFLSFMFTYEDGHEVVYCYELHVASKHRGLGFGRRLMDITENAGERARVEKAMLTVFVENTGAMAFYRQIGYVEDDYSPEAKILRSGAVKEPSYKILSKVLKEPTTASSG
ncbi:MAG: hypothetical protein M1826_000005 [Phylliscum demangeonii]|nr:MAG: hypothetical protein M1826_000005 [Phylliscum demangeonii]